MRKLLTQEEIKKVEPLETEMTEDEIAQYAYSKGFYDDEFFADYFLEGHGYIYTNDKLPVPNHIKELWEIINQKQDFNLIIARGHNKTTGILIKILKMCCYGLEREILYISTENLGEIGVGKIR
ncbi:MAG: hypothetical protein LBG52_01755 [Candidatus Peribacteria bacterium]|jgi:hypothetical protein|nr:hypothetical protein [Candidatus Peribacteria bacterium]